ncbi:MAG: DUF2863 family protein [Betaproteobacteria bacterium]|nr:DUF2863 family protein [Betaproteobacteria bacterium]
MRLLPGCALESLLPDAYFVNCRESDRRVRAPYAIRAAVGYLENTLRTTAPSCPRHRRRIRRSSAADGYRVAFTQRGQDDVVHGIVWPLFGREDDESKPAPRRMWKPCWPNARSAKSRN